MMKIEEGGIEQSKDNKTENQFQAVLELLKGGKALEVSGKYKICRSSLYKLRRRAIAAIRLEIENPRRKKRNAHNRLESGMEIKVIRLCKRYPTFSSYQISRKLLNLENILLSPRTIQRIRKRNHLPRVPKRPEPTFRAHRFTETEKEFICREIEKKLFLGGERLAWDLQNQYGMSISPSTAKRIKRQILNEMNPPDPKPNWQFYERKHPHRLWHGDLMEKVTLTDGSGTAFQLTLSDDYSRTYVFCDLFKEVTVNTTIRAIINAMQKHKTIPQALIFDNASFFKGKLLKEFCRRLGIRLIHCSVRHPQTNGKLERSFRDDMNEFYKQFNKWDYHQLKKHLPKYIHYRNQIRGHNALQGKPAKMRLAEQDYFALPKILNNLEKFAWCYRQSMTVKRNGKLRINKRSIYIDSKLKGQTIEIYETLSGLETVDSDQNIYFLPDYKETICRPLHQLIDGVWKEDKEKYYFRQVNNSRRLKTEDQL